MKKLIITAAPTGEGPNKEINPATPMTPDEIAEDVYECYQAGAAVAHIHVRDENGGPSMNTDTFEETVYRIREKCDIVLNLTTGGDNFAGDEIRMAHLHRLRPEMGSFDAGTINWAYKELFPNPPQFLEKLGTTMQELGVKPEVEVFDAGMIDNARYYIKTGVLQMPVHFQIVLGAPGGMPATIENLIFLQRMIPEGCTWSAFGVGKASLPIMTASILLGGHIRVGFEDNTYYAKGVKAESNRQLVERAVRIAKELGREIATSDEAREMLQLKNHYRNK